MAASSLTRFPTTLTDVTRANATIVVFRKRPPLCLTRSWNQHLSAEPGWCRSHSQASWSIAVRRRGLPALDTPCPRSTAPVCQGSAPHMRRLDDAREIVARLCAITAVVIPDVSFLRNVEHRELCLSGLLLAAGEAE